MDHNTTIANEQLIEPGTCHCGCGRKTYIPLANVPRRNFVKGVPMQFWRSHGQFPNYVDSNPFEIDGVLCRRVLLSRGRFAVVWDSDYDFVCRFKWVYLRGYAYGREKRDNTRTLTAMGRLLLGMSKGEPLVADHINGDTLDNRRCNLRAATHSQNVINASKRRHNKSGYLGVCRDKKTGQYNAQARYAGRVAYLGLFHSPEAAHFVYCWFARRYYEGFSREGSLTFESDAASVRFSESGIETEIVIRFKSGVHTDGDAQKIIQAIARLTMKYPVITQR